MTRTQLEAKLINITKTIQMLLDNERYHAVEILRKHQERIIDAIEALDNV